MLVLSCFSPVHIPSNYFLWARLVLSSGLSELSLSILSLKKKFIFIFPSAVKTTFPDHCNIIDRGKKLAAKRVKMRCTYNVYQISLYRKENCNAALLRKVIRVETCFNPLKYDVICFPFVFSHLSSVVMNSIVCRCVQGCWLFLSPTRKETSYSDRRFWVSHILFIIIIGWILVLYIYI